MQNESPSPYDLLVRAVLGLCVVAACKGPPAPRDAAPPALPGPERGSFALTYYWVATEGAGTSDTKLFDSKCGVLATVSAEFAGDLATAGTGRLRDGRTLTTDGECSCPRSPCFRFIDERWGIGAGNRSLVPLSSVAVDRNVISIGSKLWIKELAGLDVDQLFPHDGCVVADDVGGNITGAKIDWFVGDRALYSDIDHVLKLTSITVHDGGELCP
jgi:3D (Asp-Asp-Asp) domain-containing protein